MRQFIDNKYILIIMGLDACSSCSGDSKYRCPACSLCSCSLECVRQHKAASGCTGQRRATGFVKKRDYDKGTLERDVSFLSSAPEPLDEIMADARGKRRKDRLAAACRERGTDFYRLPGNFTKHKRNRTRVLEDGSILWTVLVREGSTEGAKVVEGQELELKTVGEDDRIATDSYEYYLKLEKSPDARHVLVDTGSTVRDLLRARTVIEFPEIIRVSKKQ